jgi:hypothetical protein
MHCHSVREKNLFRIPTFWLHFSHPQPFLYILGILSGRFWKALHLPVLENPLAVWCFTHHIQTPASNNKLASHASGEENKKPCENISKLIHLSFHNFPVCLKFVVKNVLEHSNNFVKHLIIHFIFELLLIYIDKTLHWIRVELHNKSSISLYYILIIIYYSDRFRALSI